MTIIPNTIKSSADKKKPIYNERQNTKDIKAKHELFTFDPNTISSEEALSLGIPKKYLTIYKNTKNMEVK